MPAGVSWLAMQMKARVLLLIGCIVFATPFAVAQSVAPTIDDDAFWRLSTELSERGGAFPSENLVSNEFNSQLVLSKLAETTTPGGVYLGVGPEQNFTYIASLQPAMAFIVDIRRQNLLEHLMYKAIFEVAPDRADFLALLFSRRRPDGLGSTSTAKDLLIAYKSVSADAEFAGENRRTIEDVLLKRHGFALSPADIETLAHIHHIFELYGPETGYGSNLRTVDFTNGPSNGNFMTVLSAADEKGVNRSFLASEANFQFVKGMEQRNLIVPIVGDLAGEKALRGVGQYLKEHRLTVSVFYLSNVEQYLFQNNPMARNGGARNFYENVSTLPTDDSSSFIRVSNNVAFKQIYPGFTSHVGSVSRTLEAYRDGRLNNLRDVFALSRE